MNITPFSLDYLDEVMTIWLNTTIQAHPFIAAHYWQTLYNDVRTALPKSDTWLYRHNDIIVAFITVQPPHYLHHLFVLQSHQNQGVGKQLINHIKQIYPELALDINVQNPRAVAFYRRHGFEVHHTQVNDKTKQIEYHMIWHTY